MADNIEQQTRVWHGAYAWIKARIPSSPATLRLWVALGTSAFLAFLVVRYCYWNEGSTPNIVYILGLTGLQTALLVLLTRRLLVSVVIGAAAVGIIVTASTVKVELMHMAIHAYDIFYYLASPATLLFLVTNFTAEMLLLMGAFLALGVAAYLSHRVDPTRIPRIHTAIALVAIGAITWYAAQSKDARADWRQFEDGAALSKFYGSWPEAIDALWRGQLIEAAPEPARTLFSMPETCRAAESKPPHVIVIHQESVVPPEYFTDLSYDKAMDPMFRSGDGIATKAACGDVCGRLLAYGVFALYRRVDLRLWLDAPIRSSPDGRERFATQFRRLLPVADIATSFSIHSIRTLFPTAAFMNQLV